MTIAHDIADLQAHVSAAMAILNSRTAKPSSWTTPRASVLPVKTRRLGVAASSAEAGDDRTATSCPPGGSIEAEVRPPVHPRAPPRSPKARRPTGSASLCCPRNPQLRPGGNQSRPRAIDTGCRTGSLPVEIVDVFSDPKRAFKDGIIVTPTLVGCSVARRQIIMGDLADGARLGLLLNAALLLLPPAL